MGLERIAAVVQGVKSNYDTDLFSEIFQRIEDISGKKYGEDAKLDTSFRVISDHARAAASFLVAHIHQHQRHITTLRPRLLSVASIERKEPKPCHSDPCSSTHVHR